MALNNYSLTHLLKEQAYFLKHVYVGVLPVRLSKPYHYFMTSMYKTDFYILANILSNRFCPAMVIFNSSVCSYYPGSCGRVVVVQLPICNQCLSPLTLGVRIPLSRGVIDTTLCDKVCQWLVVGRWFYLGTPVSHQQNWPPRYNWNIVEKGVKHQNPNPLIICNCNILSLLMFICTG